MKFKIFPILLILFSCTTSQYNSKITQTYNSKGFAYIFSKDDYTNKLIKSKFDNSKIQISINSLKNNTLVKIINPKTKEYVLVQNYKYMKYPDFYKILITEQVAKEININKDLPLVEIIEIKKNKSFKIEEPKIFNEEKRISSNAPVTSVKISNISKNKDLKEKKKKDKVYILIASFYSIDTAKFLKNRIIKEIRLYDKNKLKIIKKNDKKINLISGPYNDINPVKNDYNLLKKFGFEELDLINNE